MRESKFTLLEKIFPLVHSYVDEGGKANVLQFARWLVENSQDDIVHRVESSEEFDPVELMESKGNSNATLSFYLIRLNKYAKYYLKDAFAGTPLKSGDDFGYVAALANVSSLTKSELIQMNVGETSGGMDIIKRLERENLIETFTDKKDKRAKRVRLTEYGKGVFFSVLPNLERVGRIVKADLKSDEVNRLVEILGNLDVFHKEIYDKERVYDLTSIEEKYMK